MDESTLARFVAKIETDDSGCWIWTGSRNPDNGYGRFYAAKNDPEHQSTHAHRVSYQHYIGPIPEGLQIDHLCRVRSCCNPDHLEAVTQIENLRRGVWVNGHGGDVVNSTKTHCKHNHPFTPENTWYRKRPNGTVWRKCRTCHQLAMQRYRSGK